MASINVTNITILDNPASFVDPFKFEITFECVRELQADLEWKVTYVGSAESEKYDQVLDSVLVGPVPMGVNRFIFEAPAPDHTKIPKQDLLGVTVALLSCLYKDKEFIRIGYYVNNEYDDPEAVYENSEKKFVQDEMDIANSEEEDEEEEDSDEDEDEQQNSQAENTANKQENKENSNNDIVQPKEAKEDLNKGQNRGNKETEQPKETLGPEVSLPVNFDVKKIKRSILSDKPRVTRFAIDWDDSEETPDTKVPEGKDAKQNEE